MHYGGEKQCVLKLINNNFINNDENIKEITPVKELWILGIFLHGFW